MEKQSFSSNLRVARLAKGMTQAALANEICTTGMISLIENGKTNPSAKLRELLAARLGVSVPDLENASFNGDVLKKHGLTEAARLNIKSQQLSKRLNGLRGRLNLLERQHKCNLEKAVELFKEMHKASGTDISEETLLDLVLLLSEAKENESSGHPA